MKLWERVGSYKAIDCKLAILEHVAKLKKCDTNRFVCAISGNDSEPSEDAEEEGKLPEHVILIVTPRELLLCDVHTEAELDCIPLSSLVSWANEEDDITLNTFRNMKERTYVFGTDKGAFIDFLLKGYTRVLAKKEIASVAQADVPPVPVPYVLRSTPRYIELQKLGYEIEYPLL